MMVAEAEEVRKESKLTSRIQSININAQVHWLGQANPISNFLDDTTHADSIDLTGFNNLETTVAIVIVIAKTGEGGSYASMDIGIISEKAFFVSVIEVCAMVDRCLISGRATKHFRPPCISTILSEN